MIGLSVRVVVSCCSGHTHQHLVFSVETHLDGAGLDRGTDGLVKLVLSLSGISLVTPEFLGSQVKISTVYYTPLFKYRNQFYGIIFILF